MSRFLVALSLLLASISLSAAGFPLDVTGDRRGGTTNVASTGNSFLTVWVTEKQDATNVRGRMLDRMGSPSGEPFTIASVYPSPSEVVVASSGTMYCVAWTDAGAVRAMRFSSNGVPLDPQPLVIPGAFGNGLLISGSASSFLLVWADSAVAISAGVSLSAVKPIATSFAADAGYRASRVASDGQQFLVTYHFVSHGNEQVETNAVRLNASGDVVGVPVRLSDDSETVGIASNGSEFVLLLEHAEPRAIAPWLTGNMDGIITRVYIDTQLTAAFVPVAGPLVVTHRIPLLTWFGWPNGATLTWSQDSYLAVAALSAPTGTHVLTAIRFTRSGDVIDRRVVTAPSTADPFVSTSAASNEVTDVVTTDRMTASAAETAWAYTASDFSLAPALPHAPEGVSFTYEQSQVILRWAPQSGVYGVDVDWWDGSAWATIAAADRATAPSSITAAMPADIVRGARFRIRFWNESGISSTGYAMPPRGRAVRHG